MKQYEPTPEIVVPKQIHNGNALDDEMNQSIQIKLITINNLIIKPK